MTTDGRVLKGNETRRLVLGQAMRIASVEGLAALSIGRLAGELELSKSGVFALFGSKEELQLATVRAAERVYHDRVIAPALDRPEGAARLWALAENWLAYSRTRVFPGGCFFYAVGAEFDAQPGRVRDALAEGSNAWHALIAGQLAAARAADRLGADEEVEQLAFEVVAVLEYANAMSLLHDDASPYDRARTALRRLLGADPND
ncbi:TetR/AcrR family transcriptional regulator [Streptacidiphilus jiangxiensis]|uniref:Regulatory protein, tetR family n=1 Tax=Streptacidiphilus jiangxiensis TaxID=235985 RepID=A0A1H7X0C9_STRJI|nr:TetR/AcrR family transcriptional regulator [Streptacidiphilus jiangxiensis]SEM26538.1 regulatory protein, tetR family [Streptacidiphilus jiangxiensis]